MFGNNSNPELAFPKKLSYVQEQEPSQGRDRFNKKKYLQKDSEDNCKPIEEVMTLWGNNEADLINTEFNLFGTHTFNINM